MRLRETPRRLYRLRSEASSPLQREIDDELDFHFQETVAELRRRGLGEVEARAAARERFGDEVAYRRALERIDRGRVRMRRRMERWDLVLRTIRHAVRGLRRAPAFTVSVVVILALGLGANAVMFEVVDRLLLSPPAHVVDAHEVRLLHVQRMASNGELFVGRTITHPDYLDLRDVGAFEGVAAYAAPLEATEGRGDVARRVRVTRTSAGLFPLLGVRPALGRFFSAEEDRAGAEPTAVLSHEYWEREHGADPAVLGRVLDVGAGSYTVVGVAPAGFTGAELLPVDVWTPLVASEALESGTGCLESRGCYWLHAVARLAPGATVEAAEAEATAAHRAGRAEMIAQDRYDGGARVLAAPVIAARGPTPAGEARVSRWLGGVALVVLLVACFNVANLLLARALATRREVAVRLALGSGRARLVGELLTRVLVLAALGGAVGIGVARLLGATLQRVLLPDVAFGGAPGGRLIGFMLGAVVLVTVLTGVVPALQASRDGLADALRSGGRGVAASRSRIQAALVAGQAALSVVLLVGAGLFVKSLGAALGLDLGFDATRIAVVSLEWDETLPAEERQAVYEVALAGVRRLPDVRSAALTSTVPFRSSISLGRPRIPGLDSFPRHPSGGPYVNKVGSGYFETTGLTILRGRAFELGDDAPEAAPVAVVSESMARRVWLAGDALGSCMFIGSDEEEPPCTEVVGVVENHRRQELVEDDPHLLYFVNQAHPGFQRPPRALMAGTVGRAGPALGLIRDEARAASTRIRFVSAASLDEYVRPQMRSWTLGASMFTAFGLLALVVAAWGLYSVLAFDVALREQELGIRSALGAGVPRLLGLVLCRALARVAVGVAVGLLVAWGTSGFVEPLLFQVSPRDVGVYATVGVTLLGVAALAGSLPALRATRVDPREALQAE